MTFSSNGTNFLIEFERSYRERVIYVKDAEGNSHKMTVKSTYPYTTCRVMEIPKIATAAKTVFRTYTVGCNHLERFSLEAGRLAALRMALKLQSPEFKERAFNAYFARNSKKVDQSKVDTAPITIPESTNDVGNDVPVSYTAVNWLEGGL